jgi:hypothetical protein
MVKAYLGFLAALFVGYGLACLASPSILADATGMQFPTGTATVEVRAMYGGLQTAVGLLALLGLLREGLRAPMLLCLGVILFGLASGRLIGIAVDADPGSYNYVAVVFEGISAAAAFGLLSRESAGAAPQSASPV